jgi:NAD(P)-dependent dehydrogenase (short-subunit alcohol dehydrogenase family)
METMQSIPSDGIAVVFGAKGGIGAALLAAIASSGRFSSVMGFPADKDGALDITNETEIERAANDARANGQIRLVLVATGVLSSRGAKAEKRLEDISPEAVLTAFQVNTLGPLLVAKHFFPLLPRSGKSVFAAISARLGSIGDNRLGGWYSYRASKAALNQAIRTSSIELARRAPDAICMVLHPGTVDTGLSRPFSRTRRHTMTPSDSAAMLLSVIDNATSKNSGEFLDQNGLKIPW